MYLIDTNIFLEVLLAQDEKEECKRLLESIRDGKKRGIITDFTIHSVIVIMNGLKRLDELKTFLLSILAYKGLHVHCTTVADEVKATGCAVELNLDMDDAIQYSAAQSEKAEAIVSYDRHFDGLAIPRTEPRHIL